MCSQGISNDCRVNKTLEGPALGESLDFVGEKSTDVTWYLGWVEHEGNSGGKADGFCTCSSGEDDALKHEAKTAQEWLQDNNQQRQSPDLNPAEDSLSISM